MNTQIDMGDNSDLIEDLGSFIKDVFHIESRHLQVLERRFGIGHRCYTLEEIGFSFGLTRERIRQIERDAINKLSKALFVTTEFKCSPVVDVIKLRLNLEKFRKNLDALGEVVTAGEVDAVLMEPFDKNIGSQYTGLVALLMSLLEYSETDGDNKLRSGWVKSAVNKKKSFEDLGLLITKTLSDSDSGLGLFDLRVALNKSLKRSISDAEIRLAIKLCRDVEEIAKADEPFFRTCFGRLGSLADKAYRVFEETADHAPIPLRTILRELNHRRTTNEKPANFRSLQQQLVNDKRYKSVGRSGEWILSTWDDVETGTILQVMADVFHFENRALTVDEVILSVRARRPQTAANSVKMYLEIDDAFVRVGPSTYELSAWGSNPFAARPRRKPVRKETTKRDRMHGVIRDYLLSQPENTASLDAVWLDLRERVDCPKASFYSILSRFDEVEKLPSDGKSKMCRLRSQ